MPREKPAFRDNVEMLLAVNNGDGMIRISRAAKTLGVTKDNLVAALTADQVRIVKIGESMMVSVPTLARWLS